MKIKRIFLSLIASLTLLAVVFSGAGCGFACNLGMHSYGDWEVVTEATCLSSGEKHRVCSICGKGEQTDVIPQFDHSFSTDWQDEVSTCKEHTQYRVCDYCHERFTRYAAITVEHDYVDGVCRNCGSSTLTIGNDDIEKLAGSYGKTYFENSGTSGDVALYERIDKAAKKFHLGETAATRDGNGRYIVESIPYRDLGLSDQRAISVWSIYRFDHPLYYWMSTSLTYNSENITLLCVEDYSETEARAATTEAIYTEMADWISDVDESASDYMKALAAHDIIVSSISYAYDSSGRPETSEWAHSIAGTFLKHEGVCEAYAKSFQIILNYFGIENIVVGGTGRNSSGGSESHLWNMVNIGGSWYWCDLTWDDVDASNYGFSYYNFMVSDMQDTNWRDWYSSTSTSVVRFSDRHIPMTETGTGTSFQYALPACAQTPYSGSDAVRSTFRIDEMAGRAIYSINGYKMAQLVKVEGYEEFTVPEVVEHAGVTYSVRSIGAIDGRAYVSESILDTNIKKFTVSSSIEAIYEWALVSPSVEEYAVEDGNEHFAAVSGALYTANKTLQGTMNPITLAFYPAASENKSLTLPATVRQIATTAFIEVKNLSTLNLGGCNVTLGWVNTGHGLDENSQQAGGYTWGYLASHCASDFSVTVTADNGTYKVTNKALFTKQNKLLLVMDRTLTSYTLPAETVEIDAYAFFGIINLGGTINYAGTAQDWGKIVKTPNWNVTGLNPITKVVCSDVTVNV